MEESLSSGLVPVVNAGITLGPAVEEAILHDLVADGRAEEVIFNGEKRSYLLRDCEIWGRSAGVIAYFESGLLSRVEIFPQLNMDREHAFTPAGLGEAAQGTKSWLWDVARIKTPAKFGWGSIEVEADSKGWAAPVGIFYKRVDPVKNR